MSEKLNPVIMNRHASNNSLSAESLPDLSAERKKRKEHLAGSLRIFGRLGFDEGVAGHVTVRDPELMDHFWVNPMGRSFKLVRVSDLLLVNHSGDVVDGSGLLNGAAFTIHSRIHAENPKINAAAHAHTIYGKTWSSLGRLLDPITQDSCAFFSDHTLFSEFSGVVLDADEGDRIANQLSQNKAIILQNHGLLTVGETVDEAAWWLIAMERCCQAQLLAEAVGKPIPVGDRQALEAWKVVGSSLAGWFSFQPLYDELLAEDPSFLD